MNLKEEKKVVFNWVALSFKHEDMKSFIIKTLFSQLWPLMQLNSNFISDSGSRQKIQNKHRINYIQKHNEDYGLKEKKEY